jgi:hypothetical protein
VQLPAASKRSAVAPDVDVFGCTVAVSPSVVLTFVAPVPPPLRSSSPQAARTLPSVTVPSAASASRRSSLVWDQGLRITSRRRA